MAVGYAIQTILSAGTTAELVSEICNGKLFQQGKYPAIQIDDFSTSIACKDGEGAEEFTVTVIIWANQKYLCDQIANAVKIDLINKSLSLPEVMVRNILFVGRGPWIRDEEKQLWSRPIEFSVMI